MTYSPRHPERQPAKGLAESGGLFRSYFWSLILNLVFFFLPLTLPDRAAGATPIREWRG